VILVANKKVSLNYEILDKYESGIELFGFEVKSLRNKQGSLDGAYVIIRGGEAFVVNFFIPPYQPKNIPASYNPMRNRKLLLTKKEISTLSHTGEKSGLTIVPISVYNKGRRLKMELALARGKKKFDKREDIKKREHHIDVMRTLKGEY